MYSIAFNTSRLLIFAGLRCFGKQSVICAYALSTYMVSVHGGHADQKDFFMKGYREMLQCIEPERIITT